MKLINEELHLNEVPGIEAGDLNSNLFGPLTDALCEVWQMLDGRVILHGCGFGADQWGGTHQMEFEVVLTQDEWEDLIGKHKTA